MRAGFAFASGSAATATLINMFKAGDHILSVSDVYGGTNRYFNRVAGPIGFHTTMVDMTDLSKVKSAFQPNTKVRRRALATARTRISLRCVPMPAPRSAEPSRPFLRRLIPFDRIHARGLVGRVGGDADEPDAAPGRHQGACRDCARASRCDPGRGQHVPLAVLPAAAAPGRRHCPALGDQVPQRPLGRGHGHGRHQRRGARPAHPLPAERCVALTKRLMRCVWCDTPCACTPATRHPPPSRLSGAARYPPPSRLCGAARHPPRAALAPASRRPPRQLTIFRRLPA